MTITKTRARIADGLFVVALMVVIMTGLAAVPFHADEFMQMSLARDVGVGLRGDWEHFRYTPPLVIDSDAHLRLLNGPLNKTLIGLAWTLSGRSLDSLPGIYAWGLSLDDNRVRGTVPSADELTLARLPSTFLTALGGLALFVLAMRIAGRPMAYPALFLYTLHPVILLNGRRAMQEGGLLLLTVLVAGAAVYIAQHPRERVRGVLALGLATGLAVCAKHTGVVIAAAAWIGAMSVWWPIERWRALVYGAAAVVIAVLVFFVLNPPYWKAPVEAARAMLAARTELLDMQTRANPAAYPDLGSRLAATITQPFIAALQYYEAPTWTGVIDSQIAAYEALPISGIRLPVVLSVPLTLVAGLGAILLGRRAARDPVARVVFIGVVASVAITFTIPLPWQRYYLPGLPLYILCAAYVPAALRQLFIRVNKATPNP